MTIWQLLELDNELRISVGSVEIILTVDLSMRQVIAKFDPKLLSYRNNWKQINSVENAQKSDKNFLKSVWPYIKIIYN